LEYFVGYIIGNEVMNWWHCCWTELAGRERSSLFGLYGMRKRRRMLGSLCGVVGDV
jgi:hypothetical protein